MIGKVMKSKEIRFWEKRNLRFDNLSQKKEAKLQDIMIKPSANLIAIFPFMFLTNKFILKWLT